MGITVQELAPDNPESLAELAWHELVEEAKKVLPFTKSERSRQLSNWVRGGLKYVGKSGRRYFLEQDVLDYLWGRYTRDDVE